LSAQFPYIRLRDLSVHLPRRELRNHKSGSSETLFARADLLENRPINPHPPQTANQPALREPIAFRAFAIPYLWTVHCAAGMVFKGSSSARFEVKCSSSRAVRVRSGRWRRAQKPYWSGHRFSRRNAIDVWLFKGNPRGVGGNGSKVFARNASGYKSGVKPSCEPILAHRTVWISLYQCSRDGLDLVYKKRYGQ
jgi:hypothetical protein